MDAGREALPLFFGLLGRFNLENRCDGPYTTMYADGRQFGDIGELVDWETGQLLSAIDDGFPAREAREVLGGLKLGMGCLVNEDVNTGNMFITEDRQAPVHRYGMAPPRPQPPPVRAPQPPWLQREAVVQHHRRGRGLLRRLLRCPGRSARRGQ